jgi:hypothetical protein
MDIIIFNKTNNYITVNFEKNKLNILSNKETSIKVSRDIFLYIDNKLIAHIYIETFFNKIFILFNINKY